jgi:transposase
MARKHYTQMSVPELVEVRNYVNDLRLRTTQPHYYNRKQERSFSQGQVYAAVKMGKLIEVHNDREPDIRALFRDDTGTCVVIDLGSGDIITVYYNDPEDKHFTLNKGLYRWQVDLCSIVIGLRK